MKFNRLRRVRVIGAQQYWRDELLVDKLGRGIVKENELFSFDLSRKLGSRCAIRSARSGPSMRSRQNSCPERSPTPYGWRKPGTHRDCHEGVSVARLRRNMLVSPSHDAKET